MSTAATVTPLPAIAAMLATGVLFAMLDASAKHLVLAGVAPPSIAWLRFVEQMLLVLVLLRVWQVPERFRPHSLAQQALRACFLLGSTIFNFLALKTLQLAETTAIFFFAPMVITALSGPLLGEWAGWRRWLAILVGLVGVLVITRPGAGTFHIGHMFALCSMLSNSLYVIATRKLAATETAESLIFCSALVPALVMAPPAVATASLPPGWTEIVLMGVLGLFGGVGHWLLIKAHRLAPAMALAPYPYLQMIWMILFGYLFFDQLPDLWTMVGSGIIVASGLYIVHREHRLRVKGGATLNADHAEVAARM